MITWDNREEWLKLIPHRSQVMFAVFCAMQVEELWNDSVTCIAAISTIERWLEGKATAEECRAAAYAAYANAANAADANAADAYAYAAAANAANAAANAAAANAAAANAAANAAADAAYAAYAEKINFPSIAQKALTYK